MVGGSNKVIVISYIATYQILLLEINYTVQLTLRSFDLRHVCYIRRKGFVWVQSVSNSLGFGVVRRNQIQILSHWDVKMVL